MPISVSEFQCRANVPYFIIIIIIIILHVIKFQIGDVPEGFKFQIQTAV
jgi:hypothetical protein